MERKSELETLAEFVADLQFSDLPLDAVNLARLAILNIVGGLIASVAEDLNPTRRALVEYARGFEAAPQSTVVGAGFRTAPQLAALANSGSVMMAHADDWSWPAHSHLSAVLFPAVLALAECHGRTGADLITAFVAGWEVAARIGLAIRPAPERALPFTSPVHGMGTAAAAARLLGLDAARTAYALSIASDHGTGFINQVPAQQIVLRTPLGGSLGLYAAQLASMGVTASLETLPTFCGAYGTYDAAPITPDLWQSGKRGHLVFTETGFLPKEYHLSTGPYATIHGIQTYLGREPIDVNEIVHVECQASPALRTVYGQSPCQWPDVHFSLVLGIALALAGAEFAFEDVAMVPNRDPRVRRLVEQIELKPYPRLEGQVLLGAAAEETSTTIWLRDGRTVEIPSVPCPVVSAENPDAGRIERLFTRRTQRRMKPDAVEALRDLVGRLETAASVTPLAAALKSF